MPELIDQLGPEKGERVLELGFGEGQTVLELGNVDLKSMVWIFQKGWRRLLSRDAGGNVRKATFI